MKHPSLLSRITPTKCIPSFCPVCRCASVFLPYGITTVRPRAMCPRCRTLERHRLLWLYLERETEFFRAHMRVLDIGPSAALQEKFRALPNLSYGSIDLQSSIAMEIMDLTDMRYPDNSFDCILCYHVLEHIEDDHAAMSEILRVLRPGGFAIMQVPLDSARAETYENSEIRTPEERLRHFGQDDHVRIYGRDYPDRLRKAGFSVHRLPYARRLGWLRSWWCSLRYREILHICTKPVL